MTSVELRFSVLTRLLALLGFSLCVLAVVGLVWVELRLISRLNALGPEAILYASVGVPLLLAFFLYTVVQVTRARSAFTSGYTLTEAGITIQELHHAVAVVPWADVISGTYQRFGKIVTLHAKHFDRPICLMNNARFESAEWCDARDLIVANLGSRLEKRWF